MLRPLRFPEVRLALYPIYDGNVRIGSVHALSLKHAEAVAARQYPNARHLRVLSPYSVSIPTCASDVVQVG